MSSIGHHVSGETIELQDLQQDQLRSPFDHTAWAGEQICETNGVGAQAGFAGDQWEPGGMACAGCRLDRREKTSPNLWIPSWQVSLEVWAHWMTSDFKSGVTNNWLGGQALGPGCPSVADLCREWGGWSLAQWLNVAGNRMVGEGEVKLVEK